MCGCDAGHQRRADGRHACGWCGHVFVVLADQLEKQALAHSVARGLVKPCVVARCRDLHVPFATAFWIRDGHGRLLGMVLQREAGVMLEFDTKKHQPGHLPPEGIAGLLARGTKAAAEKERP